VASIGGQVWRTHTCLNPLLEPVAQAVSQTGESSPKDDASLQAAQIFKKELKHMTIRNSQKTRSISSYLTLIFSLTLLITMLTGVIAPAAQVVQQESQKAKSQATVAQRLEQLAAKNQGEMVVLPVLMHAIERHLQGIPAQTDIDRAVRNSLARHSKITKAMLQTAVNNWKSIPASTKAKLAPEELRNLAPAQKLEVETLKNAIRRSASVKTLKAATPGNPGMYHFPSIVDITGPEGTKTADGTPFVYPAKTITIRAKNVPADRFKIKVRFLKPNGQLKDNALLYSVEAGSNGIKVLKALAPSNLAPGDYQVQIEVLEPALKSNKVWVRRPGMLEDLKLPEITNLRPSSHYPGGKVTLNGKNFTNTIISNGLSTGWESEDSTVFQLVPIKLVSADAVELTVPQEFLNGKYRVALFFNDSRLGPWKNFYVREPMFQVNFNTIKCIDETNPESPGDDEIVTMWQVTKDVNYKREKLATDDSEYYEDFTEGVEKAYKPEHMKVFPTEGTLPKYFVKQHLTINTLLFEWDAGDASDAQQALGLIGDAAAGIGGAIGGWAAIIGKVIDVVLDIIGAIVVMFGGDPDPFNLHTLNWSAADLQKLTAGKQQTAGSFEVYGVGGQYRLTYTINRFQSIW
jgi:hypothetical protein